MTLKEWLAEAGKRQQSLVIPLRRSPSQISRLVNGQSRPSLDVLRRIMDLTAGAVTANDFPEDARAKQGTAASVAADGAAPSRPLQDETSAEAA